MTRISFSLIISFVFILLHIAPPASCAAPLRLFVSIAPQKYFVQQIGKALVDVHVMVPPGASPATYEPRPRQMALLANTRAYFAIGVPFENAWLNKIAAANSHMQVIHTDHGIQKLAMTPHHHEIHHQDPSGLDPHIWTSPRLVMIQARTILTALQELDPSHAQIYAKNNHVFMQALQQLDDELKTIFAAYQGRPFMVFHPSWGYFAHTYGLVQVPVEIQGKAPKSAQLKTAIERARSQNIKVVFVQPQFSKKSAELIAKSINGKIIVADPLALDWAANLRRQAIKFKAALR